MVVVDAAWSTWRSCHRGVVGEVVSSSSWHQRHGGSRCGVMSSMRGCSTISCRAESTRWEGVSALCCIAELAGARGDSPGQYPSLIVVIVVRGMVWLWSTWHGEGRCPRCPHPRPGLALREIHEGGKMVGTHPGRRRQVGDGGGRGTTWGGGGKAVSNWIITQVTTVILSHTSLN